MAEETQFTAKLLAVATDPAKFRAIRETAKTKLYEYDGEQYPRDGCAITLSLLLQEAGLEDLTDYYKAFNLKNRLILRGWNVIAIGDQKPGDVGTTCGNQPNHGVDHIYLVVEADGNDKMIVADNQDSQPHIRYASGAGGKSPTTFFLRA